MVVLGPSTTIWLRKMIVHHIPGGRAPLGSGLGARSPYAGVTIAILGDWALLAQPRSKSAKPPKAGGQFVADGGSHAPTRTRGRRSDLCSGSSALGGGGDGRLGFVTDASRGAVLALGAFRAQLVRIYPKIARNRGSNRNRRGLARTYAHSWPPERPMRRL